jgi:hypothetical protein
MEPMTFARARAVRIGLTVVAPAALLLAAAEARADSAAVEANTGFNFGIGPVVLIPAEGEDWGGGLDIDLRYGIEAGPTILAPGVRGAGYFQSDAFIGIGMPTFRVTLPVGPLAPYVLGGIGYGGITGDAGESGLALMGGGGLMIHFGRVLGIGAEATYQAILDTPFHGLAVGPSIHIGL